MVQLYDDVWHHFDWLSISSRSSIKVSEQHGFRQNQLSAAQDPGNFPRKLTRIPFCECRSIYPLAIYCYRSFYHLVIMIPWTFQTLKTVQQIFRKWSLWLIPSLLVYHFLGPSSYRQHTNQLLVLGCSDVTR